jgi:phenylpyruvate tautomerase PptA (4-oxalocrotonate tautomerase family)
MTQIKTLQVDGNPLKTMKRQIIEKGTAVILDHLRNRHQGDPPENLAIQKK